MLDVVLFPDCVVLFAAVTSLEIAVVGVAAVTGFATVLPLTGADAGGTVFALGAGGSDAGLAPRS